VAVVPGGIQRQLLAEGSKAVGDQDQPPDALGLEGPDAPLDDREASIFPNSPESVLDSPATAPPLESLRRELNTLIGYQMTGPEPHPRENSLQEYPNYR
jgi:hypothetical protein